MQTKRFVRDLKEKEHLASVFILGEKTLRADRNGKSILSATLKDASGSVNARIFEKADEFAAAADVGDVVWIKGFVQVFQGRRQVVLQEIRRAEPSEFDMTELVADLAGDPRAHLARLLEVSSSLQNPFIKQLLHDTLTAPELEARLLRTPAAKTIHHAYRGGLLEHVVSIVGLMEALAAHYPFLDRDLLMFGAIYHDIGKIFELDATDSIRYTDAGRLVGHMGLATEMIDTRARSIADFPAELKDVLKHIILSHHGKLEYGSPKLPMLAEAMVVAMIDELDSRVNTLFHFLKTEVQNAPPTDKWTHFHPTFERYFYLDFFRKRL